jgi:hypothetical protein
MINLKRVCIYPKDIQMITGKTLRQSRTIINDIRVFFKKEKKQLVTIDEFCRYSGISRDEVDKFIQ